MISDRFAPMEELPGNKNEKIDRLPLLWQLMRRI